MLYCILYNLKFKNMLLNYLLILSTLFSLLYVIIEIKKLYKEIYYIRKDIENFVDEDIESITYKKK